MKRNVNNKLLKGAQVSLFSLKSKAQTSTQILRSSSTFLILYSIFQSTGKLKATSPNIEGLVEQRKLG